MGEAGFFYHIIFLQYIISCVKTHSKWYHSFMDVFLDKINNFFVLQRIKIIGVFKIIYLFLILFILFIFITFRGNENLSMLVYDMGKKGGDFSLIIYLLALFPGIGERLGIKNKILSILRIYRRHLGILMFILVLVHISFTKLFFLQSKNDLLPQGAFETMGIFTTLILCVLFVTSNNNSLRTFKIWWYRIQRLTYISMFFIFFHVALVRFSIWSLLMVTVIILQLVSFYVVFKKTNSFTGGKPI